MASQLPPRPNLEWLRKRAKERLDELRVRDPKARLSEAQLTIAREYGFPSWRRLKAQVERVQAAYEAAAGAAGALSSADGADVSPDDPQLARVLAAAADGDFQTVLTLVTGRRALANARGPEGETPLHAAVQSNEPRLAIVLVSLGADPNATFGNSAHTALSWATTYGSMNFARALVRLGQKPDFFCAAGMGLVDEVRACFDSDGTLRPGASRTGSSRYGADGARLPCPPPAPAEQISDALYIACRNAHVDVVRFLLSHDPDLSFKAFAGGTPFHWAYFGGSREVIDLLARAGADPAARDDVLHCTPRAFGICVPANWGLVENVRERLAEDPSLAAFMDGRTSALHAAARGGQTGIVRLLLDAGASPTLRDGDGKTPRDVAEESGHQATLELLGGATPGSS